MDINNAMLMYHYCYQWMLKNIVWGHVVKDHCQSGDTDKLLSIRHPKLTTTSLLSLSCYGWKSVNDHPFVLDRDIMLINGICAPIIGNQLVNLFLDPHTRTTIIIITIKIRALDEDYINNDIS